MVIMRFILSFFLFFIFTCEPCDAGEGDIYVGRAVGTINPGEVLGISAVVEPNVYMATAIAVNDSRLLRIDAVALRELCSADASLDYGIQRVMAKATRERLYATRVLLAAATSPD